MTISSTARRAGPFLGNGTATSFAFTFKVFTSADIKVTRANHAGVETLLVLDADYTVTLNPNQETSPGGTVTYPISGTPLPVGSVLSIVGDLDYDQPLDIPAGGNFSPIALENELDRVVIQVQQLREGLARALTFNVTSNATAATMPDPVAGEFLRWKSDLSGLENFSITEFGAVDDREPLVLLFLGQSNARSNEASTGGDQTIDSNVYVWNGNETQVGTAWTQPVVGQYPFDKTPDAGLTYANNMAYAAAREFSKRTGRKVYLILYAKGSHPALAFVKPATRTTKGWVLDSSFTDLTTFMYPGIVNALTAIQKSHVDYVGVMQGEADLKNAPGDVLTITGITNANPGVLTFTGTAPTNGSLYYLSSIGGMTQLNGRIVEVANVTSTTFELKTPASVNIDTSAFGSYTSGGTATPNANLWVSQWAEVFNDLESAGVFNRTETPVAFGSIADTPANKPGRQWQYEFVHELSLELNGQCRYASGTKLPLAAGSPLHYSGEGLVALGVRIVDSLLGPTEAFVPYLMDMTTSDFTLRLADAATGGNAASVTTTRYVAHAERRMIYETGTLRPLGIGGLVTLNFEFTGITTSGMTSGNTLFVQGLPFPTRGGTGSQAYGAVEVSNVTFGDGLVLRVEGSNATRLSFKKLTSAGGSANLTVGNLTSGTAGILGTVTYMSQIGKWGI